MYQKILALFLAMILLVGCAPKEDSSVASSLPEGNSTELSNLPSLWPYGQYPSIIGNVNVPSVTEEQKESLIDLLNSLIAEYWQQGKFESDIQNYLDQSTPIPLEQPLSEVEMPVLKTIDDFIIENGSYVYQYRAYIIFGEQNEWVFVADFDVLEDGTAVFADYGLDLRARGYINNGQNNFFHENYEAINNMIEDIWNKNKFLSVNDFESEELYPPEGVPMPIVTSSSEVVIIAYGGVSDYSYIINIPFGENNEWVLQIGVKMIQDTSFGPYVTFSRNPYVST